MRPNVAGRLIYKETCLRLDKVKLIQCGIRPLEAALWEQHGSEMNAKLTLAAEYSAFTSDLRTICK